MSYRSNEAFLNEVNVIIRAQGAHTEKLCQCLDAIQFRRIFVTYEVLNGNI